MAGSDESLKACACSQLKTPKDGDCNILDEDNKNVAFPFCLSTSCPDFPEVLNLKCDIGLSYKNAMRFFWNIYKPMNIRFKIKGEGVGYPCQKTWSSSGESTSKSNTIGIREIFCNGDGGRGGGCEDGTGPGCSSRSDGGDGAYPAGDEPYYLGTGFGIWIPYEGSSAWIDKGSKLIYPYYGAGISLNGCCGNATATDGYYSNNKITVNVATDGSPCEACYDGCGIANGTVELTNLFCN
jgi:hypothetical protein